MIRRLIWVALGLGAIFFTLQAGEYSTADIFRQRKHKARLSFSVDSLRRQVDSLKKAEELIRGDASTQERISREEFGMVRGKNEVLYKFIDPAARDSAAIQNEK